MSIVDRLVLLVLSSRWAAPQIASGTRPEPDTDVESVRVLHCHADLADRPAAANVLGELADGLAAEYQAAAAEPIAAPVHDHLIPAPVAINPETGITDLCDAGQHLDCDGCRCTCHPLTAKDRSHG